MGHWEIDERATAGRVYSCALAVIEPWFDDADTRRWLGDRRWPAVDLVLVN
jgi:hypothetical protein